MEYTLLCSVILFMVVSYQLQFQLHYCNFLFISFTCSCSCDFPVTVDVHVYENYSAGRYLALTASVKFRKSSPKIARNEQVRAHQSDRKCYTK